MSAAIAYADPPYAGIGIYFVSMCNHSHATLGLILWIHASQIGTNNVTFMDRHLPDYPLGVALFDLRGEIAANVSCITFVREDPWAELNEVRRSMNGKLFSATT